MSRNKYSSFRKAERVWKTLFKANVTVLLLVLIKNENISRLNRIGRQLQPVELAAGELAVNWQTTSAWSSTILINSNFIPQFVVSDISKYQVKPHMKNELKSEFAIMYLK